MRDPKISDFGEPENFEGSHLLACPIEQFSVNYLNFSKHLPLPAAAIDEHGKV